MSDRPFHFLGADADDDDNEGVRDVVQYEGDDIGAPLLGPEEVREAVASAAAMGIDLTIPTSRMNAAAKDELVQAGVLSPEFHSDPSYNLGALPFPAGAMEIPPELKELLDQFINHDLPVMGNDLLDTGNPKDRVAAKKPDLSLNPPAAALYMALGFMDGAVKYGPFNWRENPVRARVYIAAAQRHIGQLLDGEWIDPSSGRPHIGHALACLAILADAYETGNLLDDRPLPGASGDMIRKFESDGQF